jgi:hypothetical protein
MIAGFADRTYATNLQVRQSKRYLGRALSHDHMRSISGQSDPLEMQVSTVSFGRQVTPTAPSDGDEVN